MMVLSMPLMLEILQLKDAWRIALIFLIERLEDHQAQQGSSR